MNSVTTTTEAGEETSLTSDDYTLHLALGPPRLRLSTMPWELSVAFTAGFPLGQVPENLRLMLKMLVAHFYEHRGDDGADDYPKAFDFLLSDFRAPVW